MERTVQVRSDMPGDGDERETKLLEERPVRQFTWKELSQLSRRDNAHVAYRGKVSLSQGERELLNYIFSLH